MSETIDKPVKRKARRSASKGTRARARKGRTAAPKAAEVSAEVRQRMIAEAAYFRAEARGFAPGHELEDWLAAEQEVDRLLAQLRAS